MDSQHPSALAARPVRAHFNGLWKVDRKNSESLSPLLAGQVSWLARWLLPLVTGNTAYALRGATCVITDSSSLGSFSQSLVLDGKWRFVRPASRI